ncbi:dirigent protein 18-like [Camellia sinensis]|uniref:Dirigent protein n=1 Tax=Camellia sinensis var. sinensis TaxID=542762 RepID=A0A4S4F1E6_CAMSN|nr:dirigent protein 18-like [Camellia sinensis]THG23273.1 hypothetical protein TEA_020238 [Camellia sinensis var. sinensis]
MDMLNLPSILPIAWLLFFFSLINPSFSTRTIGNPSPTHHHHIHLTFYMLDVLSESHHHSQRPVTTKFTGQLPFPKPLGFFPPVGGIPLPDPNPTPVTTQTLDLPGIGISFPARAALEELEFGTVTTIDEALFQGAFGSVLIGKAQGLYVASSEDGSSHMIAMTASFADGKYKDGLRFFGVHRTDVSESHVAVIGGTGKFDCANGYATIKTMNLSSNSVERESEGGYKVLAFNMYLG